MSLQVQCGWRAYMEHPQFHQHVGVCRRLAERTWRWDPGYDVSPELCSLPVFMSILSSLASTRLIPSSVSHLFLTSSCHSFLLVPHLSLSPGTLTYVSSLNNRPSDPTTYGSHLYLSLIYNFLPLTDRCLNFALPHSKVQIHSAVLHLQFYASQSPSFPLTFSCPPSPPICPHFHQILMLLS